MATATITIKSVTPKKTGETNGKTWTLYVDGGAPTRQVHHPQREARPGACRGAGDPGALRMTKTVSRAGQ
jgi:hypothetical protein